MWRNPLVDRMPDSDQDERIPVGAGVAAGRGGPAPPTHTNGHKVNGREANGRKPAGVRRR